jgi:hypothetical protein
MISRAGSSLRRSEGLSSKLKVLFRGPIGNMLQFGAGVRDERNIFGSTILVENITAGLHQEKGKVETAKTNVGRLEAKRDKSGSPGWV